MIVVVTMSDDRRTLNWLRRLSVPVQVVRLEPRFTILSMADSIKRAAGGRGVVTNLRFDHVNVHRIFSHPNLISLRNHQPGQGRGASHNYTTEETALMDLREFFDFYRHPQATFGNCSWGSFSTREIKSSLSYLADKAWQVPIHLAPEISGIANPVVPGSFDSNLKRVEIRGVGGSSMSSTTAA